MEPLKGLLGAVRASLVAVLQRKCSGSVTVAVAVDTFQGIYGREIFPWGGERRLMWGGERRLKWLQVNRQTYSHSCTIVLVLRRNLIFLLHHPRTQ
jgi:hypothetical protein